jgi:hypothetical protein
MKPLFVTIVLLINLTACATTDSPQQSTAPTDQPGPDVLQVENISSPRQAEVKKIKIAQPGVDPTALLNGILNGVADVAVDGRFESDSLQKENFIHVLIDDAVESTTDVSELQMNQSNPTNIPK